VDDACALPGHAVTCCPDLLPGLEGPVVDDACVRLVLRARLEPLMVVLVAPSASWNEPTTTMRPAGPAWVKGFNLDPKP
jgi:hypothetical protein